MRLLICKQLYTFLVVRHTFRPNSSAGRHVRPDLFARSLPRSCGAITDALFEAPAAAGRFIELRQAIVDGNARCPWRQCVCIHRGQGGVGNSRAVGVDDGFEDKGT